MDIRDEIYKAESLREQADRLGRLMIEFADQKNMTFSLEARHPSLPSVKIELSRLDKDLILNLCSELCQSLRDESFAHYQKAAAALDKRRTTIQSYLDT